VTRVEQIDRTEGEKAVKPSPPWRAALTGVAALVVVAFLVVRVLAGNPEVAGPPPLTLTPGEQIASLEQRVQAQPENFAAWQELGAALVQEAIQSGNPVVYTRAEGVLLEGATLAPNHPAILISQGVLALARHEFGKAAELAATVRAADPFNADALVVLIDAQVELGQYEEAAASLQQLLDLRPALPALARTSYLRELNGDLPGAEQALIQAITAGSRSGYDLAVTHSLLGDLYLKQGELDRAEERYSQAEEFFAGLGAVTLGRARIALAQGELASAVESLATLTERLPTPENLTLLGETLIAASRVAEAEDAFATVEVVEELQLDAGIVVDLELARYEADHGDPARALSLAEAAYAERPTVFAAGVMGWSLYRIGETEAALPYAEESLRLGTLDAELRLWAAEIFAASGNDLAAEEQRQIAAGLDPWVAVVKTFAAAE